MEKYVADNVTTHTILQNKKYFSNLNLIKVNMNTISSPVDLIEGTR